jgi:hypothetical protein
MYFAFSRVYRSQLSPEERVMETLHLPELVLRGREVSLRPLTLDDAPALAASSGESREQYRFSPVPEGLQNAVIYVERALQSKARGQRYTADVRKDSADRRCDRSQRPQRHELARTRPTRSVRVFDASVLELALGLGISRLQRFAGWGLHAADGSQ